jgi:glutamyl-tRNA synthetase
MSVRVRFAPSPTGLLHVGALRTVLFDYLYAKKMGGECLLRIEDTDRSRYNAESEGEFVETLRWVGIEFDEGPHVGGKFSPYRQSERMAEGIYAGLIDQLLANGSAYKAFDTTEEIDQMREFQQINKSKIGYFGGDWRDAEPSKVEAAIAEGKPFVVRLKIPRDRTIQVQDAIRGRIEFDSNTLPDPVMIKGDGMPTYHFAAMVDDHLMEITHVFRGEEWVSSSPIHVLIFEAFGWAPPIFVHCPVIIGADGKKLSKRHGATRVLDYMAQGYLKSALKNFIALIGWAPGNDEEILEPDQLIQKFSIEGLQPSPGKFDIEKLRWLNGHRIRSMTGEEVLVEIEALHAEPYAANYWENYVDEDVLPNKKPKDGKKIWTQFCALVERAKTDREYVLRCITEEKQRVLTLVEFGEACDFFLVDEPEFDAKAVDKWFGQEHVRALLEFVKSECGKRFVPGAAGEVYETVLKEYFVATGMEKIGPIVHPTRVALTGKTVGPGLFELMSVLGPDRISARINRALKMLI